MIRAVFHHLAAAVSACARSASMLALLGLAWAGGARTGPAASGDEAANYQGPCALAVSRDGAVLYVANADARQVTWLAPAGGNILRRVALPAPPSGLTLTPDGTKLIVTCAAPTSTVAVLDAHTGNLLATIRTGHTSMGPAVSPDGKRLYVCNRFDNDVSVIDRAGAKQVTRIPAGREPIDAAVADGGRSVLVANHLPDTRTDEAFLDDVAAVVTVIDAQTHATTSIGLPHGANGARGICVSPDGKLALVTHLLSNFRQVPFRVDMGWINVNVVSIIDTRERTLLSTIGMDQQDLGSGNPWDVAMTADGKTVCVSLAGTHELCLIDCSVLLSKDARIMAPMMGVWPIYPSLDYSQWRRVKLPGKGPRGLAIAGSRVYAAEYFSDTVAVADAKAGAAVGSIALGPAPQLTRQRRGELLFHDATICYQQWQSCASCHPEGRADGLNWDLMNDGVGNAKNTKSMLLSHRTPPAHAEGVRMSAEEAVRSGIAHVLFSQRPEDEAVAIDAYLDSLRPLPSPHLVGGRLGPAAERGRQLFHSPPVGCARCHPAPLYTDLRRHDVGSRGPTEQTDRFDTPTLVEVWRTAPYLHDGRYATLEALFVEGRHGLRRAPGEELTDRQIDDLVAFVRSL